MAKTYVQLKVNGKIVSTKFVESKELSNEAADKKIMEDYRRKK